MEYKDVRDLLENFSKIIVTGPQRAGTTIASKIIAQDLGYRFVDEGDEGGIGTGLSRIKEFLNHNKNVVVQCPILACMAHGIHAFDRQNIVIVYMRRSPKDIEKSQERINWHWDAAEKKQIKEMVSQNKIKINIDYNKMVSEVKYFFWDTFQKPKISNYYDLDYESLSDHPLWLDKENRKGFSAKQTE